MAEITRNAMDPPFADKVSDETGVVSRPWQGFFRSIFERLNPLGIERSCKIVAHATDVYDIEGLLFNQRSENGAIVDYLIQRVSSAEEKLEIGSMYVYYKPSSQTWVMAKSVSTGTSSVTLSITSAGQMRYQAPLLSGVSSVEKITWRSRTFSAKFRGNY